MRGRSYRSEMMATPNHKQAAARHREASVAQRSREIRGQCELRDSAPTADVTTRQALRSGMTNMMNVDSCPGSLAMLIEPLCRLTRSCTRASPMLQRSRVSAHPRPEITP